MTLGNIENVYIYVEDSMRWDKLPEESDSIGSVFKTVAQSLYSYPCFASLLTGLYPQQHGITGVQTDFPEGVRTLFDLDVDSGFYQRKGPEEDPIYDVIGVNGRRKLKELEPPFFHMERGLHTHVPFAGFDTVKGYYDSIKGDRDQLRSDYEAAVEDSFNAFQARVDEIDDQFGLENTLIIYTGDHGDLLGEYGDVTHTFPAVPELAYVPTIIKNPLIKEELENTANDAGVIEHVDITEIILDTLADSEMRNTMGTNILNQARDRKWGYNHTRSTRKGIDFYMADSMWWEDGGYVLHQNKRIERLALIIYMLTQNEARSALRKGIHKRIRMQLKDSLSFGNPKQSIKNCEEELTNFTDSIGKYNKDNF